MTSAPDRLPDDELDMLLLIRQFELLLLELFADGLVSGTTHTCLGQEYIPVAMAPVLKPAFVFSNHRCHGHYLAQFRDPAGLLAEVTGRVGGVSGGRGGSQHIYRDGFCSTGILGENVSVALGGAMTMQRMKTGGLAAVYIGDGAWGQGVVYEALNMAQLWGAPLVILVENNGIAQSTPVERSMAGSIRGRAAAFEVHYVEVTETCPLAVRRRLVSHIDRARAGGGPLVVEFRTHRLGPHSKGDDTRTQQERKVAENADWLRRYRVHYPDQVRTSELEQRSLLQRVADEVLARPLAEA